MYYWLFKILIFFHRLRLEDEGDLIIENVSDEDEGKYQCLAKNIVGTRSTDKAELFVQGKSNKNYMYANPCFWASSPVI